MNCIFEGVATALYTPFKDGGIDFEQFGKLIDRQLKSKVDALVFLGTTGESPTVTREERTEIIKYAVSRLKGKLPIIIGTGSNCTQTACELTSEAKTLGADGALIVTPYYNKCEQDGLFYHYEKISKECNFPFICYNVPPRTGVNIEPKTAKALTSLKDMSGIKEASLDKNHIEVLFKEVGDITPIYCGSDELINLFLSLKSKGIISVSSNVIPLKIKEYICDFENNYERAKSFYDLKLKDFLKALSTKINPIPIKILAEIVYGEKCEFRLPLSYPNSDYLNYLKSIFKTFENNL